MKLLIKSMIVAAVVVGLVASPVLAQRPDDSVQSPDTSTSPDNSRAERRDAAKARLSENRLKICQNRERMIGIIMSRIGNRAEKHLNLFKTISDRLKAFYNKSGKVVPNYADFVTNMDTKHAAAKTAIEALDSARADFKCDGDNPRGAAQTFRQKLKAVIQALKAYRESVREFLVAIKTVQGRGE